MQVLGYNYQQERTYDILDMAAANEGTASDIMGAGMGIGMGVNLGNTIGGFMGNAMPNVKEEVQEEVLKCPTCKRDLPADAKFCMSCGTKIDREPELELFICPHCGEKVPKGKFCMGCGKSLENICPKCGEIQTGNAKFCVNCGTKLHE